MDLTKDEENMIKEVCGEKYNNLSMLSCECIKKLKERQQDIHEYYNNIFDMGYQVTDLMRKDSYIDINITNEIIKKVQK